MLSPGRCSSCSLSQDDGPDFLDFAVNQLSVDEESEFMFPVWEERKSGDRLVLNASDHDDTKKEFQRFGNRTPRNSLALQQNKGNEDSSEEKLEAEKRMKSFAGNERKSSTINEGLPSFGHEESSAGELNKDKAAEIFDSKRKDKTTEARGTFKQLGALTKSAAIWKSRVFSESHSPRMEASLNRNKRTSVRKLGDCSLLSNLPQNKDKNFRSQKKLGLCDIATNLYAQKKEFKVDSALESTRYLSLAERSSARWLKNTALSKKTKLPPIDFASRRRYSSLWMPLESIPARADVNNSNAYGHFRGSARKQSDLNSIALRSVLQNLETMHLVDGHSRAELLNQSLASLNLNYSNQGNFKNKALPLVKSALAFKHRGNKSA